MVDSNHRLNAPNVVLNQAQLIGVILVRTVLKSYPWYLAPIEGIKATVLLTIGALKGWGLALINLISRKPTGVQIMGPVGIFGLFTQVSQLGVSYFLQFVAIISVFIALFNIILRKANVKALELEEQIGLPLHIPLPTLKKPKKE